MSAKIRARKMTGAEQAHADNYAAYFLPMTNEDQRPSVRIGNVLVFAYFKEDGELTVTVDTEYCGSPIDVRFKVNDGVVWTGSTE